MGKHPAALDVADSPDMRPTRPEPIVDPDEPMLGCIDAGSTEFETVGVADPTSGDQHLRTCHLALLPVDRECDLLLVANSANGANRGSRLDVDPLVPQVIAQQVGEFRVLTRSQMRVPPQERHPGAKAGVHLGELDPDIAATDDDQGLREVVQVQGRAVGEELHFIEAGDGRLGPAGTGGNDRVSETEGLFTGIDFMLANKPGVAPKEPDSVVTFVERPVNPLMNFPNDGIFPGHRLLHPEADRTIDLDAELGRPPGSQVHHLRRPQQGLGRHAPFVDSGAADFRLFDERYPGAQGGGHVGRWETALARADHENIVVISH